MRTNFKKAVSLLLAFVMVLSMLPTAALATEEENELPIPVTTEGKTYSLFNAENLEDQHGTTFLYVVKRGDRYYTPAHPGVTGYAVYDTIAAVDITEYWDEETNTFAGIPDSANVGVMQYQVYPFPGEYGGTGLFLNGNIMFKVMVPFEDSGETWFDGGIQYYERHETYSYSRALWEATGGGSGYFYDSYYDWSNDGEVHGALALNSSNRFAMRNITEEVLAEQTVNVSGYLYAAPCDHAAPGHSAYVAPTCMDKGCKEYWYCVYCNTYFKDEACANAYNCKPVLPALDHDYGETQCSRCSKPVPAYTKITSYEQFKTVDADASFIAVAEIDDGNGGKDYYVMKQPINIVNSDIDENGQADILLLDENSNDVPDVLERDANGDGIADAMVYDGLLGEEYLDGKLDEVELEHYLGELEREYTNGYIAPFRTVEAIEVTPAADGTITVKNMSALEFVMERVIPDDKLEEQYYGDGATVKDYENDFRFRIPNFWIRPVVTLSNNYYQQPYEQGDSKWWGVLFGADVEELELNEYRPLPVTHPDDAVLLYTESFFSLNREGQVEHALRFLINGEEKNFIITHDYWDEIEGTQYPIYLYCSDAGDEVHQHVWGPWNPNTEETHKRVCTADGCSEYELASHTPGTECTPDPENYELGHWVTCTECSGQFHEYHTREEAGRYYPNYWRDTGDGIHHVVNCTKCLGPVEYAEHDWSDWYNGNKEVDGEWVRGHYRSCDDFPCEASEWQAECIYDEGVVTTAPTCLETGAMTYTCMADPACELDTKTYTEEIPALGHDWGEWAPVDSDPTKEQRVCKRDPNHTEEREVVAHEHIWSNWTPDGDENHKRVCSADGCTLQNNTETAAHDWDHGVITTEPTCAAQGEKTYTCGECGATKKEPVAADPSKHNFGGWESISGTQHSRACRNNGCSETETEEHDLENTVIQIETCEVEGQQRDYCETCGYENYTTRPALGHNYGDWTVVTPATEAAEGLERRICANDNAHVEERPIPVLTHTHTMQSVAAVPAACVEPGNIACYQCSSCQRYFSDEAGTTELVEDDIIIPALGHDWGDWTDVGKNAPADIHGRSCNRDGCDAKETGNHEWGDWTNDGDTDHKKTCAICSGIRTETHQWGEGVVTPPADGALDTAGTMTYTCSGCGKTKSEPLTACAAHDWQWEKFPSETDYHSGSCTKCGMLKSGDHDWNEGEVVSPATQLEDGWKVYTCEICDQQKGETIPKLDVPVNSTPNDNAAGGQLAGSDSDLIEDILTEEEKAAVEDGSATVSIYLEVEDISDMVAPDEAAAATNAVAASGAQIGMYLDIDLFKDVTTSDSGTETTQITETNGKVTITIVVPDELINTDPSITRIYRIVRVHDGWAEIIEATFDPATKTLTFQTDKFSTYALAYNDTAVVTYTVTYTDGVDGTEIFADQTFTVNEGAATPVFVGTPVRSGYTFNGWSPSVAATVSGNVTYTASWTKNSSGGGSYVPASYAITVENTKNGDISVRPATASRGTVVTITVSPDKGYALESLTVTDKSGKEIELTNKGDSKYTFKMPASKITVKATFMGDNTMLNFFVDVPADAYYYDAVLWAIKEGITNGTSATTFSPDNPCTRAQMVTFLWRAAGSPEPKATECKFSDVDMSKYYGKAILWAVENGITNGTAGTTFEPYATCTRAQMAAFLYRMAGSKAANTENPFADVKEDAYYYNAVLWAAANDITKGKTDTTFEPYTTCTRAQMVTFLYRYMG